MNYSAGVVAVLVAGAVSGVTGVYFEKLIKEGPSQPSLWIRNVQLSTYSIIMAFFMGIVYQDGTGIREHGFFEGYNWVVWTAVFLQAVGGMVASVVIRDADNIVKNFATSISIVLSLLVSVFLFAFQLTWTVRPSASCLHGLQNPLTNDRVVCHWNRDGAAVNAPVQHASSPHTRPAAKTNSNSQLGEANRCASPYPSARGGYIATPGAVAATSTSRRRREDAS
jgi:hypothetical protein